MLETEIPGQRVKGLPLVVLFVKTNDCRGLAFQYERVKEMKLWVVQKETSRTRPVATVDC
jgi:hypothetical protein